MTTLQPLLDTFNHSPTLEARPLVNLALREKVEEPINIFRRHLTCPNCHIPVASPSEIGERIQHRMTGKTFSIFELWREQILQLGTTTLNQAALDENKSWLVFIEKGFLAEEERAQS
jgi:hypothetical protein